ncbi:MAG: bifunctional serine/threonine-protein kinase/formylglycine-generating enzyme family protein [Planctomycetota bacterium]
MVSGPLPPGTKVARRYRLVEQLGRGHAGEVYRARTRSGREVALELLDAEADEVAATSFQHRYAVAVHEVGRDPGTGRLYVVMDLVEGRSLEQLLREAPLRPERVVRLGQQLLEAIEAAHREGLVHRALTPSKVLVTHPGTPDEEVRVLGFALGAPLGAAARPPESAFTRQAEALRARVAARDPGLATRTRLNPRPLPAVLRQTEGLAYASPEVLLGRPFDERADLYSVGAVLYAALAQVPPFQAPLDSSDPERGLRERIEGRDPTSLGRAAPGVPQPLADVIHQALSKSPLDRPLDARVFRRALRRCLDRAPIALLLPGTPEAEGAAAAPEPAAPPEVVVRPAGGARLVIKKDDLPPPRPRLVLARPPRLLPRLVLAGAVVALMGGLCLLARWSWRSRVHGETRFRPLDEDAPKPAWAALSTASFGALPAGVTWTPEPGQLALKKDGSVLMWFPGGITRVGSHTVPVPGFFIGRHEVTWGQLARYCAAEGRAAPQVLSAGRTPPVLISGDHPAADVPFELARAYCEWAGGRLPNEAEWVSAAGADAGAPYPWGSEPPRDGDYGVLDALQPITWPVGSAPKNESRLGVRDAYGNAAEWLSDQRLATFARRAKLEDLRDRPRGFRIVVPALEER